jgi:hypothetical protein
LAIGLRSLARLLAEWAKMHKRIEFIIKNPGFEATDQALRSVPLDFESENEFRLALEYVRTKLDFEGREPLILTNEKGQQIGIHPQLYCSHYVGDVDEWEDTWRLPARGQQPPHRESD